MNKYNSIIHQNEYSEKVEKQVNKLGIASKNDTHHYKFLKVIFGENYKKTILIQNLSTSLIKEVYLQNLTNGHQPFWFRNLDDTEIMINKLGKSSGDYKNHYRFIESINSQDIKIQNLYTNEVLTRNIHELKRGCQPFYKISEKDIMDYVNKIGKISLDSRFHFEYIKFYRDKNNAIKVVIKSLFTNNKKDCFYSGLKKGAQPFKNLNIKNRHKAIVNNIGVKSLNKDEHYSYVNDIKLNGKLFFEVKNIKTGIVKRRSSRTILKGEQPFKCLNQDSVKKEIAILGKVSLNKKEWFSFVEIIRGYKRASKKYVFVKIKSLYDKTQMKTVSLSSLRLGVSPFREGVIQRERVEFHPIIAENLFEAGFLFEYEKSIGKIGTQMIFPDFIVRNPNNNAIVIVEAKHDLTVHGKNIDSTNRQIAKYHKKMLSNDKYRGTIVVSTHGISGYTIDEAIKEIIFMTT